MAQINGQDVLGNLAESSEHSRQLEADLEMVEYASNEEQGICIDSDMTMMDVQTQIGDSMLQLPANAVFQWKKRRKLKESVRGGPARYEKELVQDVYQQESSGA